MKTSKYLGRKFDGWKVVSREVAPGGHAIFTLKKKSLFSIKTLKVRDNELTKLTNSDKTIDEEIINKGYQVSKNIRIEPNTVSNSISFKNLFRSI